MTLSVQVEGIDALKREMRLLGNNAPRVIRRTLNRTLTNERTFLSKRIRQEVILKAAIIKRHMRLNRARGQHFDASVRIFGKPLGMENFGARQVRRGVSVKIRKNKPRELIHSGFRVRPGSKRLKAGTFFIRKRGRRGKRVARLPIKRLLGPSVPAIVGENPKLLNEATDYGAERLTINAQRELDYELSKR
ncbi:MAG: phage tail protein [Magnetococcales bacterium]|nr:phage tail protein [Magnetococcales bacterium]